MANTFVKSANLENPWTYTFLSVKKVGQINSKTFHRNFLNNMCFFSLLFSVDKIFVEQNAFMNWTRITVLFSLIFALLFTTYRLINRYLLPVRITVRNNFGPFEENDGKQNDVLILHSASDSEIARGVLLPVLETKYSYKCEVVELPENMASCKFYFWNNNNNNWMGLYAAKLKQGQ